MEDGIGIIGSLIFGVIYLGLIVFFIATYWKIFEKAGKPGWASLIPIYSSLVFMEIINKPKIWVLYMFIPFVGLYWAILSVVEFAKVFGKDTGFAIGIIFLPIVFLPMLAFGDAQYQGASGEKFYDDEVLDRG
ncbi:DUF5684 domain-containing protein [Bernardetia sp. OM2101]|uniref:DUF5684 domain-containing protein n=1 Tax=Bernardetia sp. OM2101 TaxID=3344876 RepID=UPI0035CFFFF7